MKAEHSACNIHVSVRHLPTQVTGEEAVKELQAYTACLVLLLYRKRRALVLTGVRKQSLHGTVIFAILRRLAVVPQRSACNAVASAAVASKCATRRQSEYAESMLTMQDFGIITLVPTARKK